MKNNEVLDFDDYAKPIDFKFNGGLYRIPSFNKSKLEQLMRINQEFIDSDTPDPNADEENPPSIDEMNKTVEYFTMQDDFISLALLKKTDNNSFVEIEKTELTDWPVRVKNKVMQTISDQMSATADESAKGVPAKKS